MLYLRLASVAAVAALAVTGCGDNSLQVPDAFIGACNDMLDNDGDGSTDYPADPGCDSDMDPDESNAPVPMCSDGRDNDNDDHIDYPADPGCFSPVQNSETDDCPNGTGCPACGNGRDDDMDGLIDYPADPGCTAASGAFEEQVNPLACGPNLIVTLLQTSVVTGTLPGSPSNLAAATCGGAGGEVPYQIAVNVPTVLIATTDLPATTVDTVLYLRTDCIDPGTEITCNDNDLSAGPGNTQSTITAVLDPGTYYLVVDARNAGMGGDFTLQIQRLAGEGQPCAMQSDCGPGLQCRNMVCSDPECNDGADSDGDLLNDYPDDPGCASPGDFDETDTCPAGPGCPACADGVDNDGDTLIDYPDDTDCTSASQTVEGCGVESDPIMTMTSSPVMGTSVGMTDDFDLTCDGTGGLDVVYFVQLPQMQSLHLDTIGSQPTDTILALYPSSCMAPALGCNDQGTVSPTSTLNFTNLAAGSYAIVTGNYSTGFGGPGPFTLNLSGTIAPGGACDVPLAMSGAIACPTGYSCNGTICVGSLACNNGVNDDSDAFIDFPADPGCTSSVDTDETDDCPSGPGCPQCGNGLDDDGDSLADFPMDPDCASASDTDESAPVCMGESDPVFTLSSSPVMDDLVGLTDDFNLPCDSSSTPMGVDRVYVVTVPQTTQLVFDTEGSTADTVLALYAANCAGAALGCDDDGGVGLGDSRLAFTNLAAGAYALMVGNYGGTSFPPGPYNLNVSGTITAGGACDGALAQSGALGCPTGHACNGMTCVLSQCNNAMDDDADTLVDHPFDPGCSSTSDNDETDDCPSGPMCPACSNDLDDDGDGLFDYPDDPSCVSAGTDNEGLCGQDTGGVTPIVIPVYTGTTAGGGNDFTPSCFATSTAEDRTYSLTLPVPVDTLSLDTNGSSLDTVLIFTDAACTAVACDDQGGEIGNASRITRTGVAAGSYGVIVDGKTVSGAYQLNVRGTVAPGTACTAMLFNTGVLVCPPNHICSAGTCEPL